MKKHEIKFNLDGFTDLQKQLAKGYKAKVGIMGESATRDDGELNNPEIGLIHEVGRVSDNMPARSFLRMPLTFKKADLMTFAIKNAKLIEQGNVKGFFAKIGIKAEAIIQEAFETGGFGQWAKNKPSTIAAKGSSAPLIDTGELRKAITSEVIS